MEENASTNGRGSIGTSRSPSNRLAAICTAVALLQSSTAFAQQPQADFEAAAGQATASAPDTAAATSATNFPGAAWETRQPSELGLDSAKLDQLVDRVGGSGCIVRSGYLARCWGSTTSNVDWASAAKPVMSTLLMIAVDEGRLASVDDRIGDWGWSLSGDDVGITFRHLANMVSGYARAEGPGDAWAYNDTAINLYGKTLERVFGTDLNTVATTRLSALQFQDGSVFGSRGGLGVRASIRDFARIGWLWANEGQWDGAQIVPRQLLTDSLSPQVSASLPRSSASDSDYLGVGSFGGGSDQIANGPGVYGFNWWFNGVAEDGRHWPDAPVDTYQANGHWGAEVVIVMPSQSIVVAAIGDWATESTFVPGDASTPMNINLELLASAVTGPGTEPKVPEPPTDLTVE